VARIVVLDSGPLGLLSRPPNRPVVAQCHAWLLTLELSGVVIAIPEIADYEVRRELLRARINTGIRRLDDLKTRLGYAPLTTGAVLQAAEFWADIRRAGVPTASPDALDADCLVAGQAVALGGIGDVVTIATTNVVHLSRFPGVDAQLWASIS
jgi:hypothetical protein